MEDSLLAAAVLVGLLLVLLISGVPIAFVLTSIGVMGCLFFVGSGAIEQMVQSYLGTGTSEILICLPLFLLMAEIIVSAGIGEDLFKSIKAWTGNLKGGIGAASLLGCGLFAAVTGSSAATIAAVGTVALWEMIRIGYNRRFASGIVGVGGTLGVLIPPSLVMILYGALTDQSIGKLFIAGVVPGVILAAGYIIMTIVRSYVNPKLATIPKDDFSLKDKLRTSLAVIPFVIIFFMMFWAFYTGVATPTEVAGVGVFAAFIVGVSMRRLNIQKIFDATKRAGGTTAFVLFIIAGAKFFTFTITATGVSFIIKEYVAGLGLAPMNLVIMMMFIYLILGCFIDPAGVLTLTIPFFLPILLASNVDLIWFGVLATINLELAYCTPPFGFNIFILRGVAPPEVTIKDIIMGIAPFLAIDFLLLAIVLLFPEIALWLPARM